MTSSVCTESRVAEGFVTLVPTLNRASVPFFGETHVRNLDTRSHPSWHARGFTLERTCEDSFMETYEVVREPWSAFRLRLGDRVLGRPHPDDVCFTVQARFRHPGTDREVWWQRITHNAAGYTARTEWRRHLDGSVQVDHFVADKGSLRFCPCRSSNELARVVSAMELDLPVCFLEQLVSVPTVASA
jgi:hypothetical protein